MTTNVARGQTAFLNSNAVSAGCTVLPVSHLDRSVRVLAHASNTGNFNLYVRGYRRLGKNL